MGNREIGGALAVDLIKILNYFRIMNLVKTKIVISLR